MTKRINYDTFIGNILFLITTPTYPVPSIVKIHNI
jgi:hypothetical protein